MASSVQKLNEKPYSSTFEMKSIDNNCSFAMVLMPLNQAKHLEETTRKVGARAGASRTTIPIFPFTDYEALRKKNEENQKALGEMATLLQQLLPQVQLSPTWCAYAQSTESGGVSKKHDGPQQNHH